jgi:hypothetical protein
MLVELLNGTLEERGESDTISPKVFHNVNKFMKPTTRISTLLLLALLSVGCRNTLNHSTRISTGMTKAELIDAIGKPERAMSPGAGVEVLQYTFRKDRLYRLAYTIKKDYHVRLVDGVVEAYGTPRELARAAKANTE